MINYFEIFAEKLAALEEGQNEVVGFERTVVLLVLRDMFRLELNRTAIVNARVLAH